MNAITTVAEFRHGLAENPISDELAYLRKAVEDACPPSATVSFTFDGRLRIAVDVHTFEEASQVEAVLPSIAGGVFHDVVRGNTPGMSFRRRVSALVER
ncbi:hypothetical protein GR702_11085 [Novosphingobium sp. FGD1]|jgi:hypothetical protein|uniref:Uncharacterized protein n=1 Tax=Novosphingobium silvae TaxID=2692619 RepID=A0A7X4GGP4_9SPHN|nr:hypothetical protein [Novosphingobium silvae]MYL98308.1 hypothetical protein [Novosphingobium silvae]